MKKKALLVGINDYERIRDLRGCHNDVTNYRDVLMKYLGYTNKDIRVLIDARATESAIKERMEWLCKDMEAGDEIFFHFSGHGSQIRDRDGDELRDGKDEILCCYGMAWDSGYITDDYIDEWFKRLAAKADNVKVDMVLDCCHSGVGAPVQQKYDPYAATNDMILTPTRLGEQTDVVSRYLKPPLDIELRSANEELNTTRFAIGKFMQRNRVITEGTKSVPNHAIWSGCGEAQTSADALIRGSYNGAFSYYFCKHVREAGGNIARCDLIEKIRSSLSYHGYTQIPELTCDNVYVSNLLTT